jgi:basic membrane protein A and related proteins
LRVLRGIKFGALAVSAALALAACSSSGGDGGSSTSTGGGSTPAASSPAGGGEFDGMKIGIAFDIGGRGDHSFNDLAAKAGDDAKAEGATVQESAAAANEPDSAKEERLRTLADAGFNPIVAVGFVYSEEAQKVAKEYPDVHFAVVDGFLDAPNLTNLVFSVNEASYLVGIVAGLKTKTDKVGFIGGVKGPIIDPFAAGYQAGVKAANPKATVQFKWLSDKADATAFANPSGGKIAANALYDAGCDIVFHAAGKSGDGLFEAAAARKMFAIGVDSDQYVTAPAAAKPYILTSSLKKVDVAVTDFIKAVKDGTVKAGFDSYDLKRGGVGYATSGGQTDDIKAQIDAAAQKVISGEIKVPSELK